VAAHLDDVVAARAVEHLVVLGGEEVLADAELGRCRLAEALSLGGGRSEEAGGGDHADEAGGDGAAEPGPTCGRGGGGGGGGGGVHDGSLGGWCGVLPRMQGPWRRPPSPRQSNDCLRARRHIPTSVEG